MKKKIITVMIIAGMLSLSACGKQTDNPGEPPQDVIEGTNDNQENHGGSSTNANSAYDGEVLSSAATVRIGRDSTVEWNVDMYNNDAVLTMLDYLNDSDLLFPTYTYEEEQGFVGQSIRGTYSRDDEVTITDIHAGELYLFSGGQLRLYFKDIAGADIIATPVGYFTETENLTKTVQDAYESNKGDTWNVDVYFWLKKNI